MNRRLGRCFHGLYAVAPLKLVESPFSFNQVTRFPRPLRRGPIEASERKQCEARETRFHGLYAVAPLKLDAPTRKETPILVSTASTPWPH